MKTLSILSASLLAFILYAFAPKSEAQRPNCDSVLEVIQNNSDLIQTNNEYLKMDLQLCKRAQGIAYRFSDTTAFYGSVEALVQK